MSAKFGSWVWAVETATRFAAEFGTDYGVFVFPHPEPPFTVLPVKSFAYAMDACAFVAVAS
jgi:hypothetical protein